MGLINSRRRAGAEDVEVCTGNPYRYPPRSGNYFGNYFIMGGERFETNQQDTYLFGENDDLNFLGSKPIPFPYPAPQAHEPTKTLKSLVNIRRDSLKFVRDADDPLHPKNDGEIVQQSTTRYNIEFTFDSDVKCAITIYYFATEEVVSKHAVYHPRDPVMSSETFHYKRGANQTFSQSLHVVDPTQFPEEDWQYCIDKEVIPIVIQCVVEEEELFTHSHVTYAIVDKSTDGAFTLKCLKQKQFVDGVGYLLQEVYGIENKNTEHDKQDDDIDDNGSECVICMCEMRDTLILPCRHLCLCNGCADNLRYQASNCPICRAKFCALLQIRAMRRITPAGTGCSATAVSPVVTRMGSTTARQIEPVGELTLSQEGVPPGFEAVSLIEALNGPTLPHCALHASVGPTADGTLQSLPNSETADRDEVSGSTVPSAIAPNTANTVSDGEHSRCTNNEVPGLPVVVDNTVQQCCHLTTANKLAFTEITLSSGETADCKVDESDARPPSPTVSSQREAPDASLALSSPRISLASIHSSLDIVNELSTDDNNKPGLDGVCHDRSQSADTKVDLSGVGGQNLLQSTDRKTQSAKPRSSTLATSGDRTTSDDIAGSSSLLDVRKSVSAWSTSTDRSSSGSSGSSKGLLSGSSNTTDSEAV